MQTVRVKWEGPFSLNEVKELDDDDEDCGLYKIYGCHIISSSKIQGAKIYEK